MKILLKIVAASALVLVTNGLLTDYYLRNVYSGATAPVLMEATEEYPHSISTLFVGDSHIGESVDPRVFGPDAYSLWSDGQCYVAAYYRLEAFLEETDHPVDTLVVSAGLHSFTDWQLERITNPPWPRFVRYSEVGTAFDQPAGFVWRRAHEVFMPYAGRFENYFIAREQKATVEVVLALQGALPHRKVKPRKEWTAETVTPRLARQFPEGWDHVAEGYVTYLRRIVGLGGAHGARVILITTPVTRAFWDEADSYVSIDAIYDIVAEYTDLTYIDYHDLYFDHPEWFRNGDHLNEAGSAVFSDRLKADLAELYKGQEQ